MTYIEELKYAIRRLHGVDSHHVKSVPVKETFQGKTVWDGIVEVFELHGHPGATHAYASPHATDDPKKRWQVAVLHVPPVTAPVAAVRAAIAKEFRSLEAADE